MGEKLINYLTRIIEAVCAAMMLILTATTFAQVIKRYVFSSSYRWAEEVAIYAMIWVAFLGAVLCLRHGEHTRIDFFVNLLPVKIRKIVEVASDLLCFAFMMLLAFYSPDILKVAGMFESPGSKIPMYCIYGSIMISAVLMIPYFGMIIFNRFRGLEIKREEDEKL